MTVALNPETIEMYYIVDEDLYEHIDVVLNSDEWNELIVVETRSDIPKD